MTKFNISMVVCSQVLIFAGISAPAQAYDLNGAWTSGGACEKLFVKTDSGISFRPDSELWGSGFIVQGNSIRGKSTRCTIKSKNEKGPVHSLTAVCATDIMVDQVKITYKVVDENKVIRVIPRMEGFEMPLTRCGPLGQ